jgi:hypothetical protein
LRVEGVSHTISSSGFRVIGIRAEGLGFRVEGFGGSEFRSEGFEGFEIRV